MCGIALIVSNNSEIPDGAIERMTEGLRHRGPDAQACVKLPNCHLGHTRLSIIDLAGGSQPMTEETKSYWIVFNGEIYNYRELRQQLEKQGWRFRTQSDTEVLLRAYQEYGEEVPAYLNGQFAFIIWEPAERRLFAARDRLGEKPLYWAKSDRGHFILASEIKSLLAAKLIEPRIDKLSVDAYLSLLYVPPERTIYENVHTLPPGQALSWKDDKLRQWSYWQPNYSHQKVSDPLELIENLQFLIGQAVKRQMVADVPVGAFLSGGLDSSTIVALMTQHTGQQVETFSVGFGDLIDELPYARAVAQAYNTNHHELQMQIPVGEMLKRMATVYDEPFGDSSNIPTYLVAEFARQHVKVVLSGDAGDELFGGYEWYRWLRTDHADRADVSTLAWLKLTALTWRILKKLGIPLSAKQESDIYVDRSLKYKYIYPDVWDRHLAFVSEIGADRHSLWRDSRLQDYQSTLVEAYRPHSNVVDMDRATDFDIRCYLPGDILVKVDRAAMAHGLETRAPFLDVDLVNFVLSLPWQLRFQDGNLKYLLRESCSQLWPSAVQQRSKQGFGAPIGNWIARPDVQSLLRRVCNNSSPLIHLLPGVPSALPKLKAQQIWTVLCLGLWLENHAECLNSL